MIGAGTMGRGIVMCLANAGIAVQWVDNNPQMLSKKALGTQCWAGTACGTRRASRIDQVKRMHGASARIAQQRIARRSAMPIW